MEKLYFSEEQRHNQWWLWVILVAALLAVVVPFSYGIYVQEVMHKPFGENPMSTEGLIVTGLASLLVMLIIFLVMGKTRLETKITSKGVRFRYPPFYPKGMLITPEEIEHYEICTFRTIREFGGYGRKRTRKYGNAFIVAGNTAVHIKLKNGKKYLIGTQKKQAFVHAMEKLMKEK
jgi:uncharacterized membrane protein YjgN (DUF898 family)